MVLPNERNPSAFGPWHSAATLASAITVIGLVMTWPVERTQASAPSVKGAPAAPCTAGTDVSNFVCRNRWIAYLPQNYR